MSSSAMKGATDEGSKQGCAGSCRKENGSADACRSELARVECGTERAEDRARRLIAMGQMAASLAHEIRNPLGSMELFCSLLKKDLQTQPQALQLADQIHLGIRTLDRIISNCLQFAGEIVVRRSAIEDPEKFLSDVLEYAHGRAAAARVKLVASHRGTIVPSADPYQLKQALLNLVLNGIEAVDGVVEANSDNREVRISSDTTSDSEWLIEIFDSGHGIQPEHQLRIFDPFFTTKEKGTGLGLAIVHSIIKAHGGTISIAGAVSAATAAVNAAATSAANGEKLGTLVTISIPQERIQ